ncbi:hypothetical protein APHAL10511_004397 [Amanita phalloides]|nr:hypothetical protein APHAL10511_004397 [Amanita phalloides]
MFNFPVDQLWQIARAVDERAAESTNADCIVPRLYLTNYPTATDPEELTRLAATHVVSVLEQDIEVPKFIQEEHKLHIRMADSTRVDLLQHLDKTTSFIHAALEENSTNVVVVHCMMGVSRSVTVVCAYLIAQKNMTVIQAIAYVQSKRPIASPNPGFVNQLETFASKHKSSCESVEEEAGGSIVQS